MATHALRARSVSELVDATFSLYRRDASSYIMVTAIASAPGLLAQLLVAGGAPGFAASLGALLGMLISIVTYALMTGVIIRVGSDVYLGGTADVAGAVKAVLPKVGTLIAVAIGKSILYGLFALLFIFPFFWAAARWFAPEAVVVLENKDFGDSFARCSTLSDGRKGHILRTLLLGYGIYFLLMIGVFMVVGISGSEIALAFAQALFTIVAYPIVGLLTMLVYYDTRIRAEGFDVEHLSRRLGSAPAR